MNSLNNNITNNDILLVISCGRRFNLFKKTLRNLFFHNPEINKSIKKCWVLDDRSDSEEIKKMDIELKNVFLDNYNLIKLSNEEKYYYVNKLNLIKKISDREDIIFFLEDDWECCKKLQIDRYCEILKNQDTDSICLTGLKQIQNESILKQEQKLKGFWKNPWPYEYNHLIKYQKDHRYCYIYHTVAYKNWSLNPNFSKAKIYHDGIFNLNRRYEAEFADTYGDKINQIFTDEPLFYHIGNDESLEQYG